MSLLTYKYYDEVIGLGKYCQLSWFIRNHGLWSGKQFIFDDMVSSSLSHLCDLLENRFSNFFLFNNLTTVEFNKFETFTIKDEQNALFSVHNFTKELDAYSYEIFLNQKQEQIKIFLSVVQKQDNLLFVRVNDFYEKLETIVRLLDTLKKLRNGKKFDLYVFQNSDFFKKLKGIDNLFFVYDQEWKWDQIRKWHGNIELWRNVFNHVKLKKHKDEQLQPKIEL